MDKEKLNKPINLSDTTRDTSFEALLRSSLKDIDVPKEFTGNIMQRIEQENIQIERKAKVTPLFAKSSIWLRGIVAVAAAGLVFLGVQNMPVNPVEDPEMAEVPPAIDISEEPAVDSQVVAENDPGTTEVEEPAMEEPEANATEPAIEEPIIEEPSSEDPAIQEPVATKPVGRDVEPVDLTEEIRLDAVVSIASAKGRLPSGALDLLPIYEGERRALAPSITEDGDLLYFIESEDGLYDLVSQVVGQKEYTVVAQSLASDEMNVKQAVGQSISKADISIIDDAVYYKDVQILPSMMDAELEYGLAPNDIFVVVNAKSDVGAIEGLWVTDIYNANMGKLSVLGGGRILAWAPDSSSLLFTDRDGSIYLGDINDAKTYLVAENGDVGNTLANYSADAKSFVISCQVGGSDGIYFVQVP